MLGVCSFSYLKIFKVIFGAAKFWTRLYLHFVFDQQALKFGLHFPLILGTNSILFCMYVIVVWEIVFLTPRKIFLAPGLILRSNFSKSASINKKSTDDDLKICKMHPNTISSQPAKTLLMLIESTTVMVKYFEWKCQNVNETFQI